MPHSVNRICCRFSYKFSFYFDMETNEITLPFYCLYFLLMFIHLTEQSTPLELAIYMSHIPPLRENTSFSN